MGTRHIVRAERMRGPAMLPVLAYTAIATSVIGAGVGAYSAYQSGQAQKQAAEYQSAVAQNNQRMADYNAKVAAIQGQDEENAKREQTAQILSKERATAGGLGLDVASGSPLRLQEDVARLGELDALTIRNNAERAAYGYKTQGINFGMQAASLQSQAQYASEAGSLGAFGSLIGGASSVSDKWMTYSRAGVFA